MALRFALTRPSDSSRATSYFGFSWSTLFLGPLTPTRRGDFGAPLVVISIAIGICIVVFLFEKNPVLLAVRIAVINLTSALFYNEIHALGLFQSGYRYDGPADVAAALEGQFPAEGRPHRLRQLRERGLLLALVGLGLVQVAAFGPSFWRASESAVAERKSPPVAPPAVSRPIIAETVPRPLPVDSPVPTMPPFQKRTPPSPVASAEPGPATTSVQPGAQASTQAGRPAANAQSDAPVVSSTPRPPSVAEAISSAQQQCDLAMATQFDADLVGVTPVLDTALLSDDDIEHAIKACEIARTGPGRRFATELGRAYAARAVRLASSPGSQDQARTVMDKAISEWKVAENRGSGAAKNFLGAAYKGTFNTKDFSFFQPDYQTALKYWLEGDEIGNVKATRNAGGLLLLGPPDFPGVRRDLPRARELLTKAIRQGDMTAASLYGQALFYNFPAGIAVGNNPASEGLNYLIMACAKGDPSAAEFFTKEMARSGRSPLLPAMRPTGC
jgi:hypothetical protein